jgi:phenylacetate-CoA ligase
MRKRISDLSGVPMEELYDIPGMTELYGPGTGRTCKFTQGFITADYYILELLNPETLEPVCRRRRR